MITAPVNSAPPDKSSFDYMWKSCICGGTAGVVAKTVTAPLDRVKILFQGFNPVYNHHVGQRLGVFKAAFHIHSTHGIPGLFQGHSVMLMRIFPSAAIRFMSYEQLKRILVPSSDKNYAWRHFLAGSLAGNIAVVATYPLEIIRSRLAYEVRHHMVDKYGKPYGILTTCKQIHSESGLLGFYRGFGATMLGVVPYAGAAFTCYQTLKRKLSSPEWSDWTMKEHDRQKYSLPSSNDSDNNTNDDDEINDNQNNNVAHGRGEGKKLKVWVHLLIGGLSGMAGQTIAYPFDTIRHRMQLAGLAPGIPLYKNTLHALKTIITREGWRALFIGLTINYWKTMPANAVAFVVYDYLKHELGISGDSGSGN